MHSPVCRQAEGTIRMDRAVGMSMGQLHGRAEEEKDGQEHRGQQAYARTVYSGCSIPTHSYLILYRRILELPIPIAGA